MPITWDKDKKQVRAKPPKLTKKVPQKKPKKEQPAKIIKPAEVIKPTPIVMPILEQEVSIISNTTGIDKAIKKFADTIKGMGEQTEQIAKENANVVKLLVEQIKGLDKPIEVKVEIPPDNKKPILEWDCEIERTSQGFIGDHIRIKAVLPDE